MTRLKQRSILVLVGVASLALAAFVALSFAAAHERDRAISRFQEPAALTCYKQLMAEAQTGVNAQADVPLSETGYDKGRDQDVNERLARWERVFAQWEDLVAEGNWAALCKKALRQKYPGELSAQEQVQIEGFLQIQQDFMRDLHEVAELGGPVYRLDYPKELPDEFELPQLSRMRDFARVLCVDAAVKGYNGQTEEAMQDIVVAMKLAQALAIEPLIISQMFRIAMNGIVVSAFEHVFEERTFSPELTQELVRLVRAGRCSEEFAGAVSSEFYVSAGRFRRKTESGLLSLLKRPWLDLYHARCVKAMKTTAKAVHRPFHETRLILDQAVKNAELWEKPQTNISALIRGISRAYEIQAQNEARLDLMQMGILLEQYYLQQGKYPATLDVIAAELGGEPLLDPFTGGAYHYKPQGERFLLYSVGRNLMDDGGTHHFVGGDIVWRGRGEE